MTTTGVVLLTDGEKADVRVFRKSPCASCEGCSGGACHAELTLFEMPNDVTVRAENPHGAHKGDVVELYSDNRFTLGVAAVLFLLPLVVSLSAAAVISKFFGTSVAVLTATVGFILVFALLAFAADRLILRRQHTVIDKILKESGRECRMEYAD